MNEITKTSEESSATKNRLIWLLLAIVTVAVYFFGLTIPLVGPDEPRYAQVAREMYERGDWVTTTLGGFHWFEKPALLYWLQIASYNIFGVSEFAARFGPALFGLGTVFSLWLLGRFFTAESRSGGESDPGNEDRSPQSELANWLFVVAASSIGLLVFSRGASFDIILTFPVTASLVGFFIFDRSREEARFTRYLSLAAFYFFIGAALLAKGLIGIVFPFAIVAFYYLLSRKFPGRTFLASLVWGTLLSLLVASSWYLPMYLRHGWEFIDEFFVQHHFQRYTSNKYKHPQPFWFFWAVLPLMTIPWLPFFLAAIWSFVKSKVSKLKSKVKSEPPGGTVSSSPLILFSVSWLVVPLIFFSFSGSKLPGYILPALPAALILTGEYVHRFARRSRTREIALQGLAFLMFAVIAAIIQFPLESFARKETVKPLVAAADSGGYADAKIAGLHTVSHNLEFYGAGRLFRDFEGRQRRFEGVSEIVAEMKRQNLDSMLVLVPLEYVRQLTGSGLLAAEVLGDNGELAIVGVKLK